VLSKRTAFDASGCPTHVVGQHSGCRAANVIRQAGATQRDALRYIGVDTVIVVHRPAAEGGRDGVRRDRSSSKTASLVLLRRRSFFAFHTDQVEWQISANHALLKAQNEQTLV
jgi:hypothetical protein